MVRSPNQSVTTPTLSSSFRFLLPALPSLSEGWLKVTRSPSYLQYLISRGRLSCPANYLRAVKLLTRNLVIVKKQNCQSNNPRLWNEAISRLAGWSGGRQTTFYWRWGEVRWGELWAHFNTNTHSVCRYTGCHYISTITVFIYILVGNYRHENRKNISSIETYLMPGK